MRLDSSESIIIVDVEIFKNGTSRILRMVLDTGATFVMIPPKIAEYLGYEVSKSKRLVQMTTPSGSLRVPSITLERVKALDHELQNVEAVCHELPSTSRVDGLLGLSFIKHFDTDIHYLQGILQIRGP